MSENIFFKLYHDTVEIRFNPVKHWYYVRSLVEGSHHYLTDKFKYVPSVTTIGNTLAKGWLLAWNNRVIKEAILAGIDSADNMSDFIEDCFKIPEQARDEAGDIGTEIHKLLEEEVLHIIDGTVGYEPEEGLLQKVYIQFKDWCHKNNIEWEFAERMSYSTEHHFVGTYDALAWIDDKLTVVDFKTSNAGKDFPYETMRLQTAAYCKMVEEEFGEAPQQRLILHVDKETGKIKEYFDQTKRWSNTWQEDYKGFLGLRQAYNWQKGK